MMREAIRNWFYAVRDVTPVPITVRIHYFTHHKRFPNVRRPVRFNDKIVRRKLVEYDQRFVERADKVAVKEFVSLVLGMEWVAPLLWCGERLPAREERNWPTPFVLKANNGSGTNIVVRTRCSIDWDAIEDACEAWASSNYGRWKGEWTYSKIKPMLLVEAYLGEISTVPWDYKLFVFGGRVEYIQVDTDRNSEHKRVIYDRDWNRQDVSLHYKLEPREITPPKSLDRMIAAAELLAEDMSFVRVDFYEIDGKPVFGEMTFFPGSGAEIFTPDSYDFRFGKLWV